MQLKELIDHIRHEHTTILLIDNLELVCVAPIKSPVFETYRDRNVAFIELPTDANKDIVCGAGLIITLEIE